MGESSQALARVSVAPCTTPNAVAHVSGSFSALLSMHATLDNAIVSATTDGIGSDIPPP